MRNLLREEMVKESDYFCDVVLDHRGGELTSVVELSEGTIG